MLKDNIMRNISSNMKTTVKKTIILICIMSMALFTMGCSSNNENGKTDVTINSTVNEAENNTVNYATNSTANDTVNNTEQLTAECNVYVLDVGQGSSTLIEYKDKYMLIDGGDSDKSSYVVSYLKNKGLTKFEYVIATHYDADHLNGIVGVLNVFDVDTLISPDYTTTTKIYDSFVKTIKGKNIEITKPIVGDKYSFGEGEFTIIAPNGTGYSNVNDYSVGIKFEFGENSFVVCGDATTISESEIVKNKIDISADVYIVNHHGSNTSSSEDFIDSISPEYAVISVGKDNSYGHPSTETLQNLKNREIQIFRTDEQGEIEFSMGNEGVKFRKVSYEAEDSVINKEITKNVNDMKEDGLHNVKYILNLRTKKIHNIECSSIEDMSEENKEYFEGDINKAISKGYEKCKRCFD